MTSIFLVGVGMYEKMIESSLNYIEENIMEDISLKSISDYFNISSFHFSRIFAFMIGESYRQYVLKRKLTHSLTMLNNNESVINTAYSYGFSYPESYSRAFKQTFGLSPKKYQTKNEPVQPHGIGKIITRDRVNFKGELFIKCEYEYYEDFIMFGDLIRIDQSDPLWMEYAYLAGDQFLSKTEKLDFLLQDYYYNEVKCIEHEKLYQMKFMKVLMPDLVQTTDKEILVEGGWFAKFHYKGRISDIFECLEADIIKWIEKKDEKLEYVGNGIIVRYELCNMDEFDLLVRLKRKLVNEKKESKN